MRCRHESGFLPIIFETDGDDDSKWDGDSIETFDDWQDERLWHFINPGLSQGFPDIDGLRQYAREARERPAHRDAFLQFHLNRWSDSSASPFVDMSVYDEGAGAVDLESLEGEPCWIAVDMGLTTDLTAVVTCWRDGDDGFQVSASFFVPADNLQGRADRDHIARRSG